MNHWKSQKRSVYLAVALYTITSLTEVPDYRLMFGTHPSPAMTLSSRRQRKYERIHIDMLACLHFERFCSGTPLEGGFELLEVSTRRW